MGCLKREYKQKKSVQFSIVTEYTFHVAPSSGTITNDAIPGVGLGGNPIQVATIDVPLESQHKRVQKYSVQDRLYFMKRAGYTELQVAQLCHDQNQIQISRKRTILENLRCSSTPGASPKRQRMCPPLVETN